MTDGLFEPTWLSPPGDSILDVLETKGWTQRELARRIGFSEKHVSQLLSGDAPLSEDAALRLEKVLGGAARFWLAREARYREGLARQEFEAQLEDQIGWLAELPTTDMRRWGWISKTRDKIEQVRECLGFFGVASVDAWREQYASPLTAFRRSDKFELKPGPVATWVRACELQAEGINCAPFTVAALRDQIPAFRELVLETSPRIIAPKLRELGAACGVAVTVVPAPKGCPASGMTKMLGPDKALLALSLRYKTHDHFWFSLFHEVGHLVLHGRRLVVIEGLKGLDQKLEAEANAFAADTLLPRPAATQLPSIARNPASIRAFAADHALHPGIVVGRMQHDGLLRFDQLNELKARYQWKAE